MDVCMYFKYFLKNKTITYRRCNIIKQRNNYNQEKCRRKAFLLRYLPPYKIERNSNEIYTQLQINYNFNLYTYIYVMMFKNINRSKTYIFGDI